MDRGTGPAKAAERKTTAEKIVAFLQQHIVPHAEWEEEEVLLGSPVGLASRVVTATLVLAGAAPDAEIVAACRTVVPEELGAGAGVTAHPEVLIGRYPGDCNKTDLAPHVGASLEVMARDAKKQRGISRSCSPISAPASGSSGS